MTESHRQPVPRNDSGELDTALAVLTFARECVIKKLVGLNETQAFAALPVDGQPKTLRWTIAHMTSEKARHAGHADILREQIDGATGR